MVHVNNIISAIVAFILIAAVEYMIYPVSSNLITNLPSDIQVFASVTHLGLFMLCLLGLPFLMAIQSEVNPI